MTISAAVTTPPAIEMKANQVHRIDLESLPQVEILRTWINDGGLNYEKFEKEDTNYVAWSFAMEPGFSVAHSIYRIESGSIFTRLEIAITRLQNKQQEAELAVYMMHFTYNMFVPFRLVFDEKGLVILQYRGPLDSDLDAFKERLTELGYFANMIMTEIHEKFGLNPLLIDDGIEQ